MQYRELVPILDRVIYIKSYIIPRIDMGSVWGFLPDNLYRGGSLYKCLYVLKRNRVSMFICYKELEHAIYIFIRRY